MHGKGCVFMNQMVKAENLKYEYTKTFETDSGVHTEKIMALDDISVSIEKGSAWT